MRTVGVGEELLVVDAGGRPVPLGPEALVVASRRGEGETAEEHDRAEQDADAGDDATHLVPELEAQQLELGTAVCSTLDEVDAELRHWRRHADARLSDRWPTVEVRTADVALRVEDAVTLAGLVRGLVETAAVDARRGAPAPAARPEVLRVAGWRAARSGLGADLVHPLTGRPAPAADVLTALLDHVGPALAEAGDAQRITGRIRDLLRRGTGADLQRRVHRESGGDLRTVVRAAVEVTAETSRAAHGPTG